MLETSRPLDVIILAAGQGTRMKSAMPKVIHPVAGRPMVAWAVKLAQDISARHIVVVTGHGAESVEKSLSGTGVTFSRQKEQLGTADAFLCGTNALPEKGGDILVLYGDTPLIRTKTLQNLLSDHRSQGSGMTVLSGVLPDATGYGRIVRDASGYVERIVEQKDATPEEALIGEFNSGVYVFSPQAPEIAKKISNNNKAGEYYLTDILGLYRESGAKVRAFELLDPDEVLGANDRVGLANLEAIIRRRINEQHMQSGVSMPDPSSVYIEDTVQIARDVTLEQGVILRGTTSIATGCVVGAYSILTDSVLANDCIIKPHSVLEGAGVGVAAEVGPFARLRLGSEIGAGAHIGNFVETKNAKLAAGVKAGHLSYLGDVSIGAESNIGAGTIVANFDGVNKHSSKIGSGVFVGSNSTIIAPRVVGDAAFIAAGSALHQDVPEGAMAIARGKQRNIEGWSRRYWSAMQDQVAKKLPWLAAWLSRQ